MRRRTGAVLAALVALVLGVSGCGDGGDDADDVSQPTSTSGDTGDLLPGMQTGPAPWEAELDHLAERLDAIGLPKLKVEGTALDLHVQLEVEVDGREVEVPNEIGLNGREVAGGRMASGFVAAIHTHDDSGLVHVHSPDRRTYTLGQLFDVWGVRLTASCVGGYCASGDDVLTVLDDGDEVSGDPRQLELRDRQRVLVRFGPPSS